MRGGSLSRSHQARHEHRADGERHGFGRSDAHDGAPSEAIAKKPVCEAPFPRDRQRSRNQHSGIDMAGENGESFYQRADRASGSTAPMPPPIRSSDSTRLGDFTSCTSRLALLCYGPPTGTPMISQAVFLPEKWRPVPTLILASVLVMGVQVPRLAQRPSALLRLAPIAHLRVRSYSRHDGGADRRSKRRRGNLVFDSARCLGAHFHFCRLSGIQDCRRSAACGQARPSGRPAFGGGFLLAIANPKAYLAIAAVFSGTGIFGQDYALDAAAKTASV